MVVSRPETRADDVVETMHGVEARDPYRWLENAGDAVVRAWVEAQNAFTRAVLDPLPRRAPIGERIRQALDVGTLGVSAPRGRYRFLVRRDAGMDQPVLTVSEAGGPPRVLVDPATGRASRWPRSCRRRPTSGASCSTRSAEGKRC